jgi:hypothetical protein
VDESVDDSFSCRPDTIWAVQQMIGGYSVVGCVYNLTSKLVNVKTTVGKCLAILSLEGTSFIVFFAVPLETSVIEDDDVICTRSK